MIFCEQKQINKEIFGTKVLRHVLLNIILKFHESSSKNEKVMVILLVVHWVLAALVSLDAGLVYFRKSSHCLEISSPFWRLLKLFL